MDNGIQKRRKASRSLIQDYQQKKIMLPFIKPRYMKEEMFDTASRLNKSRNSTPRTFSTQKQSKITGNSRVQTEPIEKIMPYTNNIDSMERQVSRYKLKDFYRNMTNKKIMLNEVKINEPEKSSDRQQFSNESSFHHSFLQRRKKKYSLRQINEHQRQKKQQISGHCRDEVVHKNRVLYTPVLLNRQIIQNRQQQQTYFDDDLKKGIIKKQDVRKFLLEKARKALMRLNLGKKKRRVFNAVLFVIYLKRFNSKFRAGRKRFIQKIGVDNIKSKLSQLKLFLSTHLHPFYQTLSSKCDQLYLIHQNQQKIQATQKIAGLKKIIKVLIDCILRATQDMNGRTSITQIVYAICKHGSFASFWQIHTVQQLDISCLSIETGYLSADRYLQYSGIISLVFVKIIIFNLLLHPQSINFSVNPNKDKSKIYFNIKLIANIFYELMITIQDKYLQLADEKFKVGNWRELAYKYNIRTSQSLTTKQGFIQKNELISGLIGHSYIRELYEIDGMEMESRILEEQVLKIHMLIKKYHETIRMGCM